MDMHQRSFSKKEDNKFSCFHPFQTISVVMLAYGLKSEFIEFHPHHACSFISCVPLGSLLSNRVKSQSILRLEKRSITNTILGNSLTISSTIQLINTNVLIQNY